jgi:hypothetical protein
MEAPALEIPTSTENGLLGVPAPRGIPLRRLAQTGRPRVVPREALSGAGQVRLLDIRKVAMIGESGAPHERKRRLGRVSRRRGEVHDDTAVFADQLIDELVKRSSRLVDRVQESLAMQVLTLFFFLSTSGKTA